MRRRLFWWELGGFLFAAAAGTLLHFTNDWCGGSTFAAAVSAVNESTWEHMKLLFFPVFFLSVGQVCFLGRNYPNFLAVRAAALTAGLAAIPVLYYTYTGVLGRHIQWVDVLIFFFAAAWVFHLDFRLLSAGRLGGGWQQVLGLLALWGLAFLFVYFTFYPPQLALWRDPATGLYGAAP